MLTIGQKLSHYSILEKLGEGGMGAIFRARDERLDRVVAIKVLRPESVADAERRARFAKEARAASALNHPHIVTIHDIDSVVTEAGPVDFLVMEYLPGGSLADRLGPGLRVDAALEDALQVADALAAAHRAGIVHRDLKPANVLRTADGLVKVVDFGLAKLIEPDEGGDAATTALTLTRLGEVVGTPAYMSPEQAEGRPVDARSDVFAFGLLLYELLSGRRPFQRDSVMATVAAILHDPVPPVRSVRTEVPADLATIVERCLERDPAKRYRSGTEVLAALRSVRQRRAAPASVTTVLRQKHVLIPLAVLAICLAATGGWWWRRQARVRWARDVGVPEIDRLVTEEKYVDAFNLARQVEQIIPDDRRLPDLFARCAVVRAITSDPPGATVAYKEYAIAGAPWETIGTAPLERVRLPFAHLRFRLSKPGYADVDATNDDFVTSTTLAFALPRENERPQGMVRVPGGRYQFGTHMIDDRRSQPYWIDRHEVTNREYKTFVDAGGYQKQAFWKHPFTENGRTLSWPEAMARFRDATGRPGPSVWELGTYPDGEDAWPVRGVSWYEAAAYAEYAGRSLPTVFHWLRAAGLTAGMGYFADIVRVSNFGTKGPLEVGTRHGISPFGALDMAGNVKEWCLNATGERRYILGGAWNEPAYLFRDPDAHPPMSRDVTFGFRTVQLTAPLDAGMTGPLDRLERDPSSEKIADDAAFQVLRSLYTYDRGDLAPRLDRTDEGSPHFRKERVTINAAYGAERLPVWVFLPRHARPPYQAVVYFPSGEAVELSSSGYLGKDWWLEFIIRSGRALIHPIYQGTYERRSTTPTGPNQWRDRLIQWSKDLGRTIDYLETRPDIDRERIAYYGISMGAESAPMLLALEPRIKATVLLWGGLPERRRDDVIEPVNFAPRARMPILMVNGRHDFIFPVATLQWPLVRLFGAPDQDKRHVLFDYGHFPTRNQDVIREVLDWLDKYLGPAA